LSLRYNYSAEGKTVTGNFLPAGMVGLGPDSDMALGSFTNQSNANPQTGTIYYGLGLKIFRIPIILHQLI